MHENPDETGVFFSTRFCTHRRFYPCVVNGRRDWPLSGENQLLPGESGFRDSSEPPLFMDSKIAEKDNRIVEGWKKDANGILIFVSPRAPINTHTFMNRNIRLVSSLRLSLRCLR
jgi:hypothetical protein